MANILIIIILSCASLLCFLLQITIFIQCFIYFYLKYFAWYKITNYTQYFEQLQQSDHHSKKIFLFHYSWTIWFWLLRLGSWLCFDFILNFSWIFGNIAHWLMTWIKKLYCWLNDWWFVLLNVEVYLLKEKEPSYENIEMYNNFVKNPYMLKNFSEFLKS